MGARPVPPDPLAPEARAARRLRVLGSFLRDHPPLLPPAPDLRDRQPVFETAIHGSSMAPAIPSGARLRVRLLPPGLPCDAGDVVFYLADAGYMVHRVVHRAGRSGARDYLLTMGDGRLAPDAPVRADRVLGIVTDVRAGSGWRPAGPPIVPGPSVKRIVRAVTRAAMIGLLRVSPSGAGQLAGGLARLESLARAAARRLGRGAGPRRGA